MNPTLALTAAAILATTSCTGVDLVHRADIPGMASLYRDRERLVRDVQLVEVPDRNGAFRIALEETSRPGSEESGVSPNGSGTPRTSDRPLIVLLHGVLSNREAWCYVAGALGQKYDLLLVDLPGCGDSDRPDPGGGPAVTPSIYSPDWLAEKVLSALREHRRSSGRTRSLVLVGHSLGGTVILHMLGSDALRARFPEIIDSIERSVLVSAVDVIGIPTADPSFREISEISGFEIAIARLSGTLWSRISRAAFEGADNPATVPYEEAERLYEILDDRSTRIPSQKMISELDRFSASRVQDWAMIERLTRERGNIRTPSLIVWGERDTNFSVSMGHLLRDSLPNAFLRTIPRSMHSLPAERPRILARLIDVFVSADSAQLTSGWEPVLRLPPHWVEASEATKLGELDEAGWSGTAQPADAIHRR